MASPGDAFDAAFCGTAALLAVEAFGAPAACADDAGNVPASATVTGAMTVLTSASAARLRERGRNKTTGVVFECVKTGFSTGRCE